jgi:hypothetical protein
MSIDFQRSQATVDGLEIVEVIQQSGDRLRGHFRALGDGRRLEIVGWALGGGLAATEVVVVADGVQAAAAPIAIERPDVAEQNPEHPGAAICGFRVELVGEGKGDSVLELFAVLEDQTREPLGRIECRSRS